MLGDYTRAASGSTTAGCDRISRQDDVKAALLGAAALPGVDLVVFEGIIVSTIFLPWLEWEKANGGMWWAFLDTPLEVCLARIQQRNGGVAVKEDQIAGKHKTIAEVRRKVLGAYPAGGRVITIRWQTALKDMKETVAACLDHIRNGEGPGEEDGPWATGWEERAGGDFPGEFDRPWGAVSMTLDAGHYQEPAAPPAPAPHVPCCPDEERNASGMCVYCGDPGR